MPYSSTNRSTLTCEHCQNQIDGQRTGSGPGLGKRPCHDRLYRYSSFAFGIALVLAIPFARSFAISSRTQHSATLTQIVEQADPALQWGAPAAIPFGTPLDSTELSATAKVPGAFIYSPASGTLLSPGTQKLSVTFTPANDGYKSATASVSLTVTPPGSSSFTLNLAPSQPPLNVIYLSPNKDVTVLLAVSPVGDFHQPVSFTCASPLPGLSCTFTPSVVRPTTTPINMTLTLHQAELPPHGAPPLPQPPRAPNPATGSTATLPVPADSPQNHVLEGRPDARRLPGSSMPVACALLLVVIGIRRRLPSTLRCLLLLVAIAASMPICGATLGCGSGPSSENFEDLVVTANSLIQSRSLIFHIVSHSQ